MGSKLSWLVAHVGYEGDDCLIWPFFRDKISGYGSLRFEGKTTTAHRVMLTLAEGPPPDPSMHSAHSCGNGSGGCVNRRHLRWASSVENNADKLAHGTDNRGEKHGMSKLTADQVREIRGLLKTDTRQRRIAERFGVHPALITCIKNGTAWGWLS